MNAKRNDPCPCGSGLKYKKCHGKIQQEIKKTERAYISQEAGTNPVSSLASRIIQALETDDNPKLAPTTIPESKASTKEAEVPILPKPRNFKQ